MAKIVDNLRLTAAAVAEKSRSNFATSVLNEPVDAVMLENEAAHRLRNVMALVVSIVQQTRVNNRNAAEYRDVLMARLRTVMQFQQALPPNSPAPVDLRLLITAQLTDICGDRLHLDPSPQVLLEDAQVRTLHLILHELATNAIKYGALSTHKGVVRVGWDVITDEMRRLKLSWTETNGPLVRPPEHLGFGSKLIKASCAPASGGHAELIYDPAGFRAEIVIPLD